MGGNYQKGLYKQLMEVLAKVDSLESEQKQDKKEIRILAGEVTSLRKDNASLLEKLSSLEQENAALTERCERLESENTLLRNDNERMKRILNNDSSNSSTLPSKDEDTKSANTYNGRKPTSRKSGAQKGYKGSCLSKAEVEKKDPQRDLWSPGGGGRDPRSLLYHKVPPGSGGENRGDRDPHPRG